MELYMRLDMSLINITSVTLDVFDVQTLKFSDCYKLQAEVYYVGYMYNVTHSRAYLFIIMLITKVLP